MKLLAYEMSRLTALFNVTRISGQLYLPLAVTEITKKYSFAGVPSSLAEMTSDRVVLSQGIHEGTAIDSMELYNDGVVISSRSNTDFIDGFFADLCGWMETALGLTMIKTRSVDRIYDSNILVETSADVLKPLNALSGISEAIEGHLRNDSGLDVKYEPFGLSLAPDQTRSPNLRPSAFRLERRAGSEYSLNQFMSSAPLKTTQHLRILEQLERQLA